MARREAAEERTITTSADAKAFIGELRDRAARIRVVPGLLDGALDELRSSIEHILRAYEKMSRRRLGPFQRDLEAIAKRVEEVEDAGKISPRHAKLVGQALQHARRVHFWNARRVLAKIEKVLAPSRAWHADLEAYRAFHRKSSLRIRGTEEALVRLREVPKPPASPEDGARLKAVVEACNRAADESWSDLTHRPTAEAIADLVGHPDLEGLGLLAVQEFAALRELGDLFEAEAPLKETIGTQTLAELVQTSEYSAAKWDRVYPHAVHVRRKLQGLLHQVRPVVGGKYGTAFTADAPVSLLERRLAAWRRFPDAEGRGAWGQLAELRASERIPAIQESTRIYEKFPELGPRAWDGSLVEEIEAHEKERAAARKALAGLPAPDALLH